MSEKKFAAICEYLQLGSGQEPIACCTPASYRVTAVRTVSCAPNSPGSQRLDVCAAHQMSLGQIYIFDGQPYSVGWCLSFEYLLNKERAKVINKQTTDVPRTTNNLAETIWSTSRADEGTISATGADIVAKAIKEKFVVIDRNDLPEVKPSSDGYGVWAGGTFFHPHQEKELPSTAYQYLAVSEYLRANPPVDEKAVKELAAALDDIAPWDTNQQRDDVARRLVAEGWKREVTS